MEKELTVLVIEDNQMFRRMALDIFSGCKKHSSEDAETGLEIFKKESPDITIVDIGLPGMSGLEVLPKLLAHDPEAFIVMVTQSSLLQDVKKSLELGAASYIIKPFNRKKITECIDNYHEFKHRLSELTPEEKANNYINKIKTAKVEENILQHKKEKEQQEKVENPTYEDIVKDWRILFVDDLYTNCQRAKLQLAKLGCEVDIALNSDEVVKKTKNKFYNIIFIDSSLGKEMEGYKAAKEVIRSQSNKNILDKSIIITLVESNYEIEQELWKKSQINNYIKKPARFTELKKMIYDYAEDHIQLLHEEIIK